MAGCTLEVHHESRTSPEKESNGVFAPSVVPEGKDVTLAIGWTPDQSHISTHCADTGDSIICKTFDCRYGWAQRMKNRELFYCTRPQDGPAYCDAGESIVLCDDTKFEWRLRHFYQ
jgi:hypothetical protein